MRILLSLAFVGNLFLGSIGIGLADTEHPTIANARRQLATYDLDGERTTRVLVELGQIDRTAYLHEIRLARFLRAIVAADLLVLAELNDKPELTGRVGRAYDVAPDAIVAVVDQELAEVGRFSADTAADARAALARLRGLEATRGSGPRSDVLFVDQVLAAAHAEDPIAGLAALSAGESALPFDRAGRQAAATVIEALAAVERLEEAVQQRDPFSAQLAEQVAPRRDALRAIVLAPQPRAEATLGLGPATSGRAIRPDLVISVQSTEVRYAFVPRVSFSSGEPALVSERQPALPEMGRVALGSLPAWPRAIDELVSALEPLIDEDTDIALGGAADAQAHLLTRAWQSVTRAGGTPRWLVASGPEGRLVGAPARAVRGAEGATEIYVRLGGHSVSRRGARSVTLPRERTDSGWRFDWAGLAQAIDGPAALRYMGVVPLRTVMTTAFTVGNEVTLDFP